MNQVQVLLLKFGEDLVEVVWVVETKFFVEEIIINSDKVLCKEHFKLGIPVLFIHVLSLQLLELECIALLVFVKASGTTSWKSTTKGWLIRGIGNRRGSFSVILERE